MSIFLLPLYWMVSASLHPVGEPLPTEIEFKPTSLSTQNYLRVFEIIPIGRYIINSLIVVSLAVPLTLVTGSWAGFSVSQLPLKTQKRLIVLSLALLMVPGIALWSTRFFIYKYLGWQDSFWALIAPAWMGTSPFYVLMFYRAYRRIPKALFETARINGASAFQTWGLVAFPIARPTTIGVALLSFALYWGDFISPLLYLKTQNLYTLPVGLQLLQQLGTSDWPLLMSAGVLATTIPVVLFVIVQPLFSPSNR